MKKGYNHTIYYFELGLILPMVGAKQKMDSASGKTNPAPYELASGRWR